MDKKYFPLALIVVSVAIAAIILIFFSQQGLVVEGILIDAGEEDAFKLFSNFSEKETFLVSPQFHERTLPVDHLMFNGTAMFLQVLEGNGKKAIQVVRIYNENNEFDSCITNYGDVNISETLEKEECLEYLLPENGGIIFIEFPNDNLSQSTIQISEDILIVKPKTEQDIGETAFLSLKIMYKNSREVIENSNKIIGEVLG